MAEPQVRTVDWYIDRAMIRSGAPSERQLSGRLGLAHNSLTNYRTHRAWPSDQAMIALADLAGIDPDVALMDLNRWRTKSDAARDRYERLATLLEKAGATAAAILLGVGILAGPGRADAEPMANRLTLSAQNCTLSDIPCADPPDRARPGHPRRPGGAPCLIRNRSWNTSRSRPATAPKNAPRGATKPYCKPNWRNNGATTRPRPRGASRPTLG